MGNIKRLPPDLANQIAAGEVVERPASVVKELLENAIDAGSTRIDVDLRQGGIELIRISDNGCGMEAEDAKLAMERHATSKLHQFDDLQALTTFGFRGEALPSIASVSRFTMRTRRAEDAEGIEIFVEGGAEPVIRPCGSAPGTTIEIKDLFYNVPARRKFLKAVATESAHVASLVEAVAIAAPHLTITLSRNGRLSKEWLRTDDWVHRVQSAFPAEELAELSGELGYYKFKAMLGRPERARSSTSALKLFVNERLIRDRTLSRTISQAYGSVLPPGRYPVGAVFLFLPADLVDVNAHPQKAEVRFADTQALSDWLYKSMALELGRAFGLAPVPSNPYAALNAANKEWAAKQKAQQSESVSAADQGSIQAPPTATIEPNLWTWQSGTNTTPVPSKVSSSVPSLETVSGESPPFPTTLSESEADPWGLSGEPTPTPSPAAVGLMDDDSDGVAGGNSLGIPKVFKQKPMVSSNAPPEPAWGNPSSLSPVPSAREFGPGFANLRFLAQARNMFLICEGKDGLTILDQHAAAERVTFHRLKQAFAAKNVAVQPLLFPSVVAVEPEGAALVEQEHERLLRAGMDVRAVGERKIAIHGVPQLLIRANPERLLLDLLDQVSRSGAGAYDDAIDMALATMACHGSVRAGDRMTAEEATALLVALDDVDFAGHCPHGRPIVTVTRWDELERKVGRK
jgi:DNA mismatch repair protein MutL